MTLKQLFKRYLKEKNYYGTLVLFMKMYYGFNIVRCRKALESCTSTDLFWYACSMAKQYRLNWYYKNKSLFEFVQDWCEFKDEIKRGDILTVKTLEGKYEYEYVAYDVWLSRMEVETDTHSFIKLERISKINGKECNYANNWKFKKEVNNIHKK